MSSESMPHKILEGSEPITSASRQTMDNNTSNRRSTMWKFGSFAAVLVIGVIAVSQGWLSSEVQDGDVGEDASRRLRLGSAVDHEARDLQANRTRRNLQANRTRYLQSIEDETHRLLQANRTRRLEIDEDLDRNLQANRTRRSLAELESSPEYQERELFDILYPEVTDLRLPSPCKRVDPGMPNEPEWRRTCQEFLNEALIQPDCTGKEEIVPRIYHSVSKDSEQFYHQLATSAQNPSFERHHLSDKEAADFVAEHCGADALEAYHCFAPPAYRADLFRFCALYAKGGVYLDVDIMPFVPLEKLYSPCSVATVGHDFPWMNHKGKQMKILASAPGAPIFKCAVDSIVNSVRDRSYPESELALTGPQMLQHCYEMHHEDVAITYHDTRNAEWPYTGMRAGHDILAYELPMSEKHFWLEGGKDDLDYTDLFKARRVYKDTCAL